MFPDSKWLEFFSLPGKVTGGLFGFFVSALLLDYFGVIALSEFASLAKPVFILAAVLTGFLFLGGIIAFGIEEFRSYRKTTLSDQRRAKLEGEKVEKRARMEATVIARLDHLTKEEISVVADALTAGGQSFFGYVHSPAIAAMGSKGLLNTPGGQFNRDHFPFCFHDFVWKEMQARREEFLAKHQEFERIAEAEKRAARNRGRR